MFQFVDSTGAESRRSWMGTLARADLEMLELGAAGLAGVPFVWLRRPETGLMMVRGRAGGTGERFNVGEMTVTRCALRLQTGENGLAYVQGRSHRKAELAALVDALLQGPETHQAAREAVLDPVRRDLEERAARMQRKSQATRVEFFTVAREAGQ